jgi:hypothetical protein
MEERKINFFQAPPKPFHFTRSEPQVRNPQAERRNGDRDLAGGLRRHGPGEHGGPRHGPRRGPNRRRRGPHPPGRRHLRYPPTHPHPLQIRTAAILCMLHRRLLCCFVQGSSSACPERPLRRW